MTDAIDLTTEQRSQLNSLLRRFLPGVSVWAYGSRVKWTARPNSDLDLVAFATPAQRSQVTDLKEALAESNLPFPVDLHVWDEVPERFREIIRKEYVVVQEAKQPEGKPVMTGESSVVHIPSTAVPLPSDWRWERLDKVCDGVFDCPHSTPVLTADGPLVVRSQDMRTGVFRMEEAGHVSEGTYQERIVRAEPKYGDLFYSREGTYFGIAAEVPAGVRVCLGQRMVLLRPKPTRCNSRFLRFWLNSPVMASHTHGHRDGTVAERLNLPTIRQLPVAVPPLDIQRAIANILGTLDDKIELNRRMNETLEAMARALFKSWFVDFDPVRAKAEGRDTRLPKHLADHFPDSFEDSELGEIPSGWEMKPFADTIEIVGGGTPKTSVAEYWAGDIPWFSVVDAPTDSEVWVVDTEKKVTRAGVENSSTRVLPVGTTIISARGTVGRIALVGVPMAMNQSCYGLRGRAGAHGFFSYFLTRELVARLRQHAHGSVFDTITRDTLAGVSVVEPEAALIEEFEKRVASILHRMREGLLETRTLAAVRDTLLPKLISGEVSVAGIEAESA